MKLPVVLFVFCLGLISLAQSNTQSSHQGHGQPIIDGSQSPELIPDLTAYRLFLVVAARRPGDAPQGENPAKTFADGFADDNVPDEI